MGVTVLTLLLGLVYAASAQEAASADTERAEWSFTLPFVENGPDDLVTTLPDLGDVPNVQYAGDIQVRDGCGIFYWFFGHQTDMQSKPIVVWLNGGPGSSSFIGLFEELGPYQFDPETHKIQENEHSWLHAANLLFVENPVGTGLSWVDESAGGTYVTDMEGVGRDFHAFLLGFYRKHPELMSNDLYITGESYGGKYVPSIATYLDRFRGTPEGVPLRGVAIGDGLVHPVSQRHQSVVQAYANGLIDADQREIADSFADECTSVISQGATLERGGPCDQMMAYLEAVSGNVTSYDVRRYGAYDRTDMTEYLNRPEVLDAIHSNVVRSYATSSPKTYKALAADVLKSSLSNVTYLLRAGERYKVLLYNGNFDMKDGPLGTEEFLSSVVDSDYRDEERMIWTEDGEVAGYFRRLGPASKFVTVSGAGHFVPTNQPKHALKMIERLVGDETSWEGFCESKDLCSTSNTVCSGVLKDCKGTCQNGMCKCGDSQFGRNCFPADVNLKVSSPAAAVNSLSTVEFESFLTVATESHEGFGMLTLSFSSERTERVCVFIANGLSGTSGPSLHGGYTHSQCSTDTLASNTFKFVLDLGASSGYIVRIVNQSPTVLQFAASVIEI